MRLTIFIPLLILGISCAISKNTIIKPNELNGTWLPVKQELEGTLLPAAVFEK